MIKVIGLTEGASNWYNAHREHASIELTETEMLCNGCGARYSFTNDWGLFPEERDPFATGRNHRVFPIPFTFCGCGHELCQFPSPKQLMEEVGAKLAQSAAAITIRSSLSGLLRRMGNAPVIAIDREGNEVKLSEDEQIDDLFDRSGWPPRIYTINMQDFPGSDELARKVRAAVEQREHIDATENARRSIPQPEVYANFLRGVDVGAAPGYAVGGTFPVQDEQMLGAHVELNVTDRERELAMKQAREEVARQQHKPKIAADYLEDAARTYRERNALYGDSYKEFGRVMQALFPDGMPPPVTVEDFNRLGIYVLLIAKMQRYAANMATGGHADSALDGSVYFAMLREITEDNL